MPKEIASRSLYARMKPETFEDLLLQSESDAETFADAILTLRREDGSEYEELDTVRHLVAGKPDKVIAPKRLTESLSGFVRIFHGWHKQDYVWHIEHAAIRRSWTVPVSKVIYIIARVMHDCLPDIEAKIWPPPTSWQLKVITFKGLGLIDHWGFTQDVVENINSKLFAALNKIV